VLLLYQAGYEVGRYVSLERFVQDSSDTYHEALRAAGIGWHAGKARHHAPGWSISSGSFAAAYKEIRVPRGRRRWAGVRSARRSDSSCASRIAAEFTVADVRRAAPAASQSYISKTLASMRDEGLIGRSEPGRTRAGGGSEASSESSRCGQWHDAAASDREGCKLQRGEDVVALQLGIVGEQGSVDRHASCEQSSQDSRRV